MHIVSRFEAQSRSVRFTAMSMCATVMTAISLTSFSSDAMAQATNAWGRDKWADSARREIELAAPAADRARLAATRLMLDKALTAFPNDPLLQHYLGYALWREANMLLGGANPSSAKPLLEQADEVLEKSSKRLTMPETFALRSSVTGQMIGLSKNPLTGMRLGPRASALADEAERTGARNPRVWLLKGMNAMYTPAMWGGGLDKATTYLQRAKELFASDKPAPAMPAWGAADVHIYLGQIHAKQGQVKEPRAEYDRALSLQPDNGWVKLVLLPALEKSGK